MGFNDVNASMALLDKEWQDNVSCGGKEQKISAIGFNTELEKT